MVFALVLVAAGCGSSSSHTGGTPTATVPQATQVDTVHVVRTSDDGPSNLAPFDYTGHDATKTQTLYTALLALPAYVATGRACPTDLGVQYELTFLHSGSTVLHAIADPSGCQVVVINGQDNRTAAHSVLWAQLAAAVGVSTSQVYPVPTA
jgi:hypothetical protein